MTTHPAIVSIRRVLALALEDGSGPTVGELEAAFGAARELPPVWGASYSVLSFERRGPLGLFAHVDDAIGRAVELIVRRY